MLWRAEPAAPAGVQWRFSWRWRSARYLLLALPFLPVLLALLALRLSRRRSPMVGVADKRSGAGSPVDAGHVLVHGVSLGEVNLMRPLLPRLEAALGSRCLLTTTTATGRAQLDQLFPDHQRAFFPFDLPWAVARFLGRSRPRLVVLLEFEVWPLFLCACFARSIPVMVVNAKISARSYRRFRYAGALVRPLFATLSAVLAQNAQWAGRLRALGVRPSALEVCGSMKADMVVRADVPAGEACARRYNLSAQRPVLLLASTSATPTGWGEEEHILPDGVAAWHARGWQVVVCPRHPERGGALAERLIAQGAVVRRSSLGERVSDVPGEILIVDQIGQLAGLYAWTAATGGIAVVGGSLGSGRGGQNMLEAAAHGCCTVVGTDTRNFPDAMQLLRATGGIVEADANAISGALAALAGDPQRRRLLGSCGERAWAAGRGATERVVAAILQRCPGPL